MQTKRTEKLNKWQLRRNLLVFICLFVLIFVFVIYCYGYYNYSSMISIKKQEKIEEVAVELEKVSLKLKDEISSLEDISDVIYEAYLYSYTASKSDVKSDLPNKLFRNAMNTSFKLNLEISGVTIVTPYGARLDYYNPYSAYYYRNKDDAFYDYMYNEGFIDPDKGMSYTAPIYGSDDNVDKYIEGVKTYPSSEGEDKAHVIIVEKNLGPTREWLKSFGYFGIGTTALINENDDIIYINKDAVRNEKLIRQSGILTALDEASGIEKITYNNEVYYLFYDRSVSHGCKLLFLIRQEELSVSSDAVFPLIISSIIIIILAIALVFAFLNR